MLMTFLAPERLWRISGRKARTSFMKPRVLTWKELRKSVRRVSGEVSLWREFGVSEEGE